MGRVIALRCKECGREQEVRPSPRAPNAGARSRRSTTSTQVAKTFTRASIASRPPDLWRYHELLPVDGERLVGRGTGFTPLLRAPRPRRGGSASASSGSSTTRPAIRRSRSRTGSWRSRSRRRASSAIDTVGCASTGNLANAVAAGAAAAGLRAVVLVPEDLEAAKILGTAVYGATLVGVRGNYDRVNRLCAQIADRYGWGFVNVNLRRLLQRGLEDRGLRDRGAARLAAARPRRGADGRRQPDRQGPAGVPAARRARPRGGSPGAAARCPGHGLRADRRRLEERACDTSASGQAEHDRAQPGDRRSGRRRRRRSPRSVAAAAEPRTRATPKSSRASGCWRETEGLFAETAGGTVVAAARRLAEGGAFDDGAPVVLLITGHGLKTVEHLAGRPAFTTDHRRQARRLRGLLGRAF